jgi:predicted AAA+ superfamily ATPase
MFQRYCNLSESNSFFLFGARGTGKTTLLSQQEFLKNSTRIDLLDPNEESRFSLQPKILSEIASSLKAGDWIVIDEVQKVPKLLDLVHKNIEEKGIRFALTGSSARKLKRGGANLLAGRAFVFNLFPLTCGELGAKFDLHEALSWGTLPKLYTYQDDKDRARFLNAYVNTYIKEEIQVEQLVRNLDPFRLFLQVAAQMNGEIINYSNIAKDTGVDIKSVQNYFQILCDTHLGSFLAPYSKSVRKVQKGSPKFYFFDTGIKRALEQTTKVPLVPRSSDYGNAFETYFVNECIRRITYLENDYKVSYLRTKDDVEIDLIIERPGNSTVLIEIKSTESVDERHIRNLKRFSADFAEAKLLCVSRDPTSRNIGNIEVTPWQQAFEKIGL